MDNNTQAFLALVRAGLWEQDVWLSRFRPIDFQQVLHLAEEQSVVGLVAAGIGLVRDVKVPKEDVLQFVGQTLQLEQRNSAMNHFIGEIVDKMREEGLYSLLVKGQGLAQCYEKPLWRSCGDVDLLLSDDGFMKAKLFLSKIATSVGEEEPHTKHLDMSIAGWPVELHGTLNSQLSCRVDKIIDETQQDIFDRGNVRSWMNGNTTVYLPSPDNDVIIVFTHILQHLFKGGIGLRQICDFSRLLWTYRESLNHRFLETRIKKARLMTEWKVLAALSVDCLGMPLEGMPLYDQAYKWKRKANKVCSFIMEVGNFGHNRELCYAVEQSAFVRKYNITKAQLSDSVRLASVFPIDGPFFFFSFFRNGLKKVVQQS